MARRYGLLTLVAIGVATGAACAAGGDESSGDPDPNGGPGIFSDSAAPGCETDGNCVDMCESARQNKSTVGCDYYAVFLNTRGLDTAKMCFAAFITNTSDAPVTIQLEHAGKTLDAANFSYLPSGAGKSLTYTPLPNGKLPPGDVAIVFLSDGLASTSGGKCPPGIKSAFHIPENPPLPIGTAIGDAYHIITSAPVVAYDIFPYGGGDSAVTSATLLLPTAAWDTNYIAVNAYKTSASAYAHDDPTIGVVAAEDNTTVTINARVPIVGGNGVAPARANTPTQYKLDKGQFLQISQQAELTGSVIQSDKPIGHWGGSSCITIPLPIKACDSAHQQIPPVRALGHEYVAVRYRNRIDGQEESPPWRMVGAVDGTVLTWDPSPPAGAPTSLAQGELVEFNAAGPFSVKSQDETHPFYMAAYMSGCGSLISSNDNCPGDPEFVNVVPPQQYLGSYVFFTDPTYPETNLVLIRAKDGAGGATDGGATDGGGSFRDVKLDCAGTITGWAPIGSGGNYEYARVDLVRHNFQGQNGCDNGRHKIDSDGPFGVTVWGWGSAESGDTNDGGFSSQAVSYAYPAGASIKLINKVVIPPSPR
jgi:IgGFc binding protein